MKYLQIIKCAPLSRFSRVALACLWVGLAGTGEGLAGQNAPDTAAKGSTLKIVRLAMVHALGEVNAKDAQVAIELNWTKHLANVFPGLESKFEVLEDVATAAQYIRSGQLHGLALSITHYLQLRDLVTIQPIFISSRTSQPLESYVLLVRQGVDWKTLGSQSRKRLMVDRKASPAMGRMWLETVLQDRQLPDGGSFFSEISADDKFARIILPVFFGQADACLVPESAYQTMVEMNPQVRKRLKVLERSPGFIKTIHCVTPLLPQEMTQRFIDRGMVMEDTVEGRQLLLIFQVKKNFLFHPSYLAHSESIYRKYQQRAGNP